MINRRKSNQSTLVTPRVAADLANLPEELIEDGVADGSVYAERIRGERHVSLEDTFKLAARLKGEPS